MQTHAMLVAVTKHYNVWVMQLNKLETSWCGFWGHAANMDQQEFPATQFDESKLWHANCNVVHVASAFHHNGQCHYSCAHQDSQS